jgi:Icc-related predicted phosphoesterase
VTQVLCGADPRGSAEAIEGLGDAASRHDVEAICVVGDLGDGSPEGYRRVFRALGEIGLPAFCAPCSGDAPVADYLREAYNSEIVFPFLRGVHGTVGFAPGHVLFAGMGGGIVDDPDADREETRNLSYPRWEAEYRLKVIRELDEHELVLAFATPPEHKGKGMKGSEAVAELIGTHRPRLVVCGGDQGQALIGRSLVVCPGSLGEGRYAVADIHAHSVEFGELRTRQTAAP